MSTIGSKISAWLLKDHWSSSCWTRGLWLTSLLWPWLPLNWVYDLTKSISTSPMNLGVFLSLQKLRFQDYQAKEKTGSISAQFHQNRHRHNWITVFYYWSLSPKIAAPNLNLIPADISDSPNTDADGQKPDTQTCKLIHAFPIETHSKAHNR